MASKPKPKKSTVEVVLAEGFTGSSGVTKWAEHKAWIIANRDAIYEDKTIVLGAIKYTSSGELVQEYTDSNFPPPAEPTQLPA